MELALLGICIALSALGISVSIITTGMAICRAIRGLPGWQAPGPDEEAEEV